LRKYKEPKAPQILAGLGKKIIIFCKGKAGGWTAFPEERFNEVTTNIMPQYMAKYDIIDVVWEGSL
jgi:hypothetical protein